jgi:hypothetical protein
MRTSATISFQIEWVRPDSRDVYERPSVLGDEQSAPVGQTKWKFVEHIQNHLSPKAQHLESEMKWFTTTPLLEAEERVGQAGRSHLSCG